MTGSSTLPVGITKTSTRSVSTTGPSATMFRTRELICSALPAKPAMNVLIASRPMIGSIGMLWYTASSVKYSAISSGLTFDHAAQNRRTISIGLSLSLATVSSRSGSLDHDCRYGREAVGELVPGAAGVLRAVAAAVRASERAPQAVRVDAPGVDVVRLPLGQAGRAALERPVAVDHAPVQRGLARERTGRCAHEHHVAGECHCPAVRRVQPVGEHVPRLARVGAPAQPGRRRPEDELRALRMSAHLVDV